MVGLPPKTLAKDVWQLFSREGHIKDIVLPRKRDKFGNRIGFIKTGGENVARKIIDNLNGKTFMGAKLHITLAKPNRRSSQSNSHHSNQSQHAPANQSVLFNDANQFVQDSEKFNGIPNQR